MKDDQDTGHGARPFLNSTGRRNSLSFYRAAPKRFLEFDFEETVYVAIHPSPPLGSTLRGSFSTYRKMWGLSSGLQGTLTAVLMEGGDGSTFLYVNSPRRSWNPITVKGLSPSVPTVDRQAWLNDSFLALSSPPQTVPNGQPQNWGAGDNDDDNDTWKEKEKKK